MQACFLNLVQESSSKEATLHTKNTIIGDNDDDSQSHSSTAQLVEELNHVEDALEEAAAQLEDSSLEEKRVEFEEEFIQSGIHPATKVTQMVDEEMERFRTQWEIHHCRLSDTVTSLQDALEAHGIDIGAFYKEREQMKTGDDANHHGRTEGTDTPSWVAEADALLDKRDIDMNLPMGAFKGASREYDAV
jgi:chromosome segregation ATPase